ncbi:hypothetical protein PUN28_009532 [Cardiocondyla obscurior]|uniref:Uncharacterized protein n=1 Tax=Cardiocondyla obscurior TaxID=286306 RepID=A0AAW2FUQ9_9HYME
MLAVTRNISRENRRTKGAKRIIAILPDGLNNAGERLWPSSRRARTSALFLSNSFHPSGKWSSCKRRLYAS